MKSVSATLIVFLILLVQSCEQQESPINPPTVFEDYFIRYIAPDQAVKAQAIFAKGDSLKNARPLSFAGGVAFIGSGMSMRQINDNLIRYSVDRQIEYANEFRFSYKSEDGTVNTFNTGMTPIEDFFLKSNLSKANGMDIVINGGLLTKDESLVFIFSDVNSVAASHTLTGPTKNIEFHLSPDQIQKLSPGPGKLYLVKKTSKNETIENREIHVEIEYYTKDIEIEIIN